MKYIATMLMALMPNVLFAHDYKVGTLKVEHPFSYERLKSSQASAGYLEITNEGDHADRLLSVKAEFPRVMIHNTVFENGVAKMVHLPFVEIAPGETVSLAPGGKHIMFMGAPDKVTPLGDSFTAVLTFEQAGDIEVFFKVEDRAELSNDKEATSKSENAHTHH